MTIDEKIVHSSKNEVRLYKEGIFWVAYEQSAYICAQHKKLKVSKKYVKKVSGEIVKVGFPEVTLTYFKTLLGEISAQDKSY